MTTNNARSADAKERVKKSDSLRALKSSIMILSIVGTMAGWLILLNQEAENIAPATTSDFVNSNVVNNAFMNSTFMNNEQTIEPTATTTATTITDISQLRQVNAVAPIRTVRVVARTRSSR